MPVSICVALEATGEGPASALIRKKKFMPVASLHCFMKTLPYKNYIQQYTILYYNGLQQIVSIYYSIP